jgi:hypothetical protein
MADTHAQGFQHAFHRPTSLLTTDLVGFDRTSLLGKEQLQPLRGVPE